MIATDTSAMIAAIGAAFPELAGRAATVHDGGWDSVAIEIDGWLCKFPRDEDGPSALRREAALLARVRPRLRVTVPDMAIIETSVVFSRHRLLVGGPVLAGDYASWDDAKRAGLADDVAGFLAELHAIEGNWPTIAEHDDEDDIDDATALMLLPPELRAVAERVIADHAALGPDPLGEGLCYLDAHGRNFAYDHQVGRLNGVFDFGDAGIAGRHEEFVEPAYIGRHCVLQIIDGYERLTDANVDRLRVALLIGRQRLDELAENADHPRYGVTCRTQATEWFTMPTLEP